MFGEKTSPWVAYEGGRSAQQLPQFLPIIFELAYQKLNEAKFLEVLRQKLYANVRHPVKEPGLLSFEGIACCFSKDNYAGRPSGRQTPDPGRYHAERGRSD